MRWGSKRGCDLPHSHIRVDVLREPSSVEGTIVCAAVPGGKQTEGAPRVGVDITEKSEPWWGIKEVLEAGGIAA